MKYRKKPVVIEAVQWTGNLIEIQEFCPTAKVKILDDSAWKVGIAPPVIKVVIPTLEGDMEVSFRDFVIKGVNGEFYPCKPDIFKKTYKPVDEAKEADSAGEVVRALRQLSVETGSLACMGCGREHNCGTHGCAILRASANLHEKQQARIEELETQLAESKRETKAAVEENDFRKTIQLVPLYTCGGHGYSDDDDEDFWCPVCRAHLGTHQGYATTCPRCGQTINPEFDPEWDYQEMKETIWSGLPEKWRGPQEAEKGAAE